MNEKKVLVCPHCKTVNPDIIREEMSKWHFTLGKNGKYIIKRTGIEPIDSSLTISCCKCGRTIHPEEELTKTFAY